MRELLRKFTPRQLAALPEHDKTESEVMRRALPKLFAGAVGRFRNVSTHTHRNFGDLHEAMEELMVASRLLRFLDEPGRR